MSYVGSLDGSTHRTEVNQMPVICRLLKLSPEQAEALIESSENLQGTIKSCSNYSDVYRYWHGIQYLLSRHSPQSVGVNWLESGKTISVASGEIPASRVLSPEEVRVIASEIGGIVPEDLIPHYLASALDEAQVYPRCWQEWEETFDPLGQTLEHYHFLQEFVTSRASAGDALLLHFEFMDDGSV